jgi:DNA-binding MarR family transcriptional regulator
MNDVNKVETVDHMAYLLHMATRRFRAEAEELARSEAAPLAAAQARMLDLVPADGARVTDLANAMRISKQGIGQLVSQLVSLGLVEVVQDPTDRRAKRITRTPAGDRIHELARVVIDEVEQRWSAQVGQQRYRELREVLSELVGSAGASA